MGHCYGKISFHGHYFGCPHGHCLPLSPYHPKRRHRLSDRGLCIYTGLLPFGMCVYCHWAFHLLPYGKPAHSRCRDLRHTAAQHPLARAFKLYTGCRIRFPGRFPYPVDPGVFYPIPADRPYPPFPWTGSSRSGSPYRNLFRKAEHI